MLLDTLAKLSRRFASAGLARLGQQVLATFSHAIVSTDGVPVVATAGKTLAFRQISNGVTALAGGGQGSATVITKTLTVLGTVATAGDSAKLPAATGSGAAYIVVNSTANSANVFPATGGAIDGGSANAAVAIAGGKRRIFVDVALNTWVSILGA